MKLQCYDQTFDVTLQKKEYLDNNNLAIVLMENNGCPFGNLTVNLGEKLPPNQAYVDINNCEWAADFIRENKLGKFLGLVHRSGFVYYPLYEFDLERFE